MLILRILRPLKLDSGPVTSVLCCDSFLYSVRFFFYSAYWLVVLHTISTRSHGSQLKLHLIDLLLPIAATSFTLKIDTQQCKILSSWIFCEKFLFSGKCFIVLDVSWCVCANCHFDTSNMRGNQCAIYSTYTVKYFVKCTLDATTLNQFEVYL